MNPNRPLTCVALVGAESTGKTTLAEQLTRAHDGIWVPEYVRSFVDRQGQPQPSDFDAIARGQLASMEAGRKRALEQGKSLLVYDTCLITNLAYGRILMNLDPPWLRQQILRHQADLYLLLETDVPWVPDGQREFAKLEQRQLFQQQLRELLGEVGATVQTVQGSFADREATCRHLVGELLAS